MKYNFPNGFLFIFLGLKVETWNPQKHEWNWGCNFLKKGIWVISHITDGVKANSFRWQNQGNKYIYVPTQKVPTRARANPVPSRVFQIRVVSSSFFLFYTLYFKKKLKTRAKQFKQFPRGDYVILTPTEVTNTCQMSTALNCESTRNCGVRGEVVQSVVVLVNYTLCGCVPKWAKSPRHKIHMETFIIKMDPVTTISSTFLILKIN